MIILNRLTVFQSMQMIEDLLKDIIASTISVENNIKRNIEAFDASMNLRQIKEDSKVIYHLLDRVTSINSQTTFVDSLIGSPSFEKRVFDYEKMLVKMGEVPSESVKTSL